jgi:hypothetical protein
VSLDAERLVMATSAQKEQAIDISSHDWDIAKDISRDGQSILFEDASEASPSDYSVAIRRIDGTPPTKLGDGSAGGLSPDGKWAISIIPGSPGRVLLLPIGPGQPRAVPVTGLERIANGNSRFLADGKTITLNGNQPGHGVRSYLVNVDDGKLTPITPEGTIGGLVSPDGKYMLRANEPGEVAVYPTAGGSPHLIPNLAPGFIPVQWSGDEASVYGYRQGQIPAQVYQVNLITGQQTVIQELQPATLKGVVLIAPVVVSRDGSRFAYGYYQVFSVLYVISGLR